jgi:polyisoprenoid-binding protein YceI
MTRGRWKVGLFPLTLGGVLLGGLMPDSSRSTDPPPVIFRLTPASRFEVKTGKAGLFGFAGHSHLVRARSFSGWVVYPADHPAASRLEVFIPAESLEVLTPNDTAEVRKVTETMRTQVLRVGEYPDIRFSATVAGVTATGFRLDGHLSMVGHTRAVPVAATVHISGDTLRADGTFTVKQTDFGIKPVRAGPGGTVKVADKVQFTFAAVAVRDPAAAIDSTGAPVARGGQ